MVTRRKQAAVWAAECRRCGYKWTSTRAAKPTRCSRCKAENFDRPARPYRRRKR